MEDNNSSLEEHRIDLQRAEMARRGGDSGGPTLNMHDPRLSKLIGVGGTIMAALIIGGVTWAGSQLVGIRESLASMAATQKLEAESVAMQIADLKTEMGRLRESNNYLIQKVASLEGKAERGLQQGKVLFHD